MKKIAAAFLIVVFYSAILYKTNMLIEYYQIFIVTFSDFSYAN